MRTQTLIKKIDEVLKLWQGNKKQKEKAVKKLVEIRNRLALKLQEEQKKEASKNPTAYNLTKWYYGIWNGQLPEGNFGRAVNVFKELLEEFKLTEEEIKQLYLWWKNLDREQVPANAKKQYSIILTAPETRSITDFKGKLRYIKGLKRELENQGWISEEYKHNEETYGSSIVDVDQIINNQDEDDEDVPF